MAARTNSTGDSVALTGYQYRSDGESRPAERVGNCMVCGKMTFDSFSMGNTVYEYTGKDGQRVVLCAVCANDFSKYQEAERRFGPFSD